MKILSTCRLRALVYFKSIAPSLHTHEMDDGSICAARVELNLRYWFKRVQDCKNVSFYCSLKEFVFFLVIPTNYRLRPRSFLSLFFLGDARNELKNQVLQLAAKGARYFSS